MRLLLRLVWEECYPIPLADENFTYNGVAILPQILTDLRLRFGTKNNEKLNTAAITKYMDDNAGSKPWTISSTPTKMAGDIACPKPDTKGLMSSKRHKSMLSTDKDCERVRVIVRVRPPTEAEEGREDNARMVYVNDDKGTIILQRKGGFIDYTEFKFDAVLSSTATQADVYNIAAQPVVLGVLDGYNGTIMAYGPTGAGKTYTLADIVLDDVGESVVEGIIPRSAAHIFQIASTDKDHEYHISMSYIQIYLETIQDLLRPENSNLQIREGEDGDIFVAGTEEVEVKCIEDVITLLMVGNCNRRYAFTKLNAHSSRSHAIVIMTVEKRAIHTVDLMKSTALRRKRLSKGMHLAEMILVGKLFLVDLAGSERLKKSGSEGLRASEAMSVNMSLTVLGKCISARADPTVTHVPFRDSKLTRLLQESLGGNAKTCLIINIAPCSEYIQETLSSLQFGSRAMKVGTKAIINFEEEFRMLTKNLQEELHHQDECMSPLEEKRDVEVVAGSQLMANSAAKVLKSLSLIDDFFTKKCFG